MHAAPAGQLFARRCHLEAVSPLGFWSVRRALPLRAELRVYPDLFGERKQVAALFLNRGAPGHPCPAAGRQGPGF